MSRNLIFVTRSSFIDACVSPHEEKLFGSFQGITALRWSIVTFFIPK
jgi:hypothetical protein